MLAFCWVGFGPGWLWALDFTNLSWLWAGLAGLALVQIVFWAGHLLQDVHNNLADVVQVCDAKKKQTNYLRNLTSDLARGNRGPICNNFCSYNIISLSHHPHQYTIVCLHTQEISFSVLTHCWCTLYADNTQNTPTMHIRIHNHTHIHFVLHLHTLSQHLHTQYTQVSFPAVGVDTRHLQV